MLALVATVVHVLVQAVIAALVSVTSVPVHVVTTIVTLDLKRKVVMVHESDPLPTILEIGSSSHLIQLIKS